MSGPYHHIARVTSDICVHVVSTLHVQQYIVETQHITHLTQAGIWPMVKATEAMNLTLATESEQLAILLPHM